MKREYLWIGIIVGILGLCLCLLITKNKPTTTNTESETTTSTTFSSAEGTTDTNPSTPNITTNPTNPNEGNTENTLPDTKDPLTPTETKCEHKELRTETIQEVSCHANGIKKVYCEKCDVFIKEIVSQKLPHSMSSEIKDATCEEDGELYDICAVCGYKRVIQTISKNGHKEENVIITERSCTSRGEIQTICSVCKKVLNTQYSPQYTHQWIQIADIFPTPFNNGSLTYQCFHCEEEKTEKIVFEQNGNINLCIPSLRLNCEVILAECNQNNTDLYDVSCDFNFINEKNPLFFGHSTKTLGKIQKLNVGDLIYFTINGKTSTYKIIVSEEGKLIDNDQNIQGIVSGELCISNKSKETLHFFTCYETPTNKNGRWIVLAEKI